MLENLRKKLDLSWIKANNIWDIAVYGSFARGKSESRDIDIAVIMDKITSVKEKMEISQKIRHMISEKKINFDVKVVDMNDFLNPGFLAREAIFAEGYSILKNDYVAERFGFTAVAIMEYSLKGLSPSKQKMFYYALQGRKKGTGILAEKNGRIVSKGVVQIPTRYYEEIKDLFEQNKVSYKARFLLQYRILH